MSSLMDLLGQQVLGQNVGAISKQLGTDENSAQKALGAALPMLLGALSKNASKPEGAEALDKALSRDHDGSVLDNLGGFLGNPEAANGAGILKHVFGNRQRQVETSVSKMSGIDSASAGKLLAMVAPLVLGALGKQKKEQNLDANALAGMLGREREAAQAKMPIEMGILGRVLDADGDGDVDISDILSGASKLGGLGKLFGGR